MDCRSSARHPCGILLLGLSVVLSSLSTAHAGSDRELFTQSAEAALEALELYGPYEDAEATKRVNDIGYALAQASGYDRFPFSFYVIDMAVPNAFALPAGHIFVTRGMLALDLTDDMLAGLLGHEVAHVSQEHFLKMRRRATLLNILSQALTAGVMIGASQGGSANDTYVDGWGVRRESDNRASLVQGAAAAGALVTELLLRSYSRENEDEADEEGQRYSAGAGRDPEGTRRLMSRMEAALPQDQSFGYWLTHPFFEDRVRAARARKSSFRIQEPASSDSYRRGTQERLLSLVDDNLMSPRVVKMIKESALIAWPAGERAERIRLERLHETRESLQDLRPLSRDYASILDSYREEMDTVRALTPDTPFLGTLLEELRALEYEVAGLYPDALEILNGGVYGTPFLESFLRNFPDSKRSPVVALDLGKACSRLDRQTDAVRYLLEAWRLAGEEATASSARKELRALAPQLHQLAALEQLASQEEDAGLSQLAESRLQDLIRAYDQLENGSEFLEQYPDHHLAPTIRERLNALADKLYKEVVLYQQVGDHGKAVAGIHRILTLAPLSPAARMLSERVVVDG